LFFCPYITTDVFVAAVTQWLWRWTVTQRTWVRRPLALIPFTGHEGHPAKVALVYCS